MHGLRTSAPFTPRRSLRFARDSPPREELLVPALALTRLNFALRRGELGAQGGLPVLGVAPLALGVGRKLPQDLNVSVYETKAEIFTIYLKTFWRRGIRWFDAP